MVRTKVNESWDKRLEREGNDEFCLLYEVGPGHFGSEHLMEMREQVCARLHQMLYFQRINMWVGGSAALWAGGGVVFWYIQQPWLLLAAAIGLIASLAGYVAGSVLIRLRFESNGELEYTLNVIDEELRIRAARKQSGAPRK
jgi:hypothetical protein